MRELPYLLRRALFASFDDGLFAIAKGAAYSALLSFFPILTTVATVFVQIRADFVQRNLVSFLSTVLPPGTEGVVMQRQEDLLATPQLQRGGVEFALAQARKVLTKTLRRHRHSHGGLERSNRRQ